MTKASRFLAGLAASVVGCRQAAERPVEAGIPSGWIASTPPVAGSEAARCVDEAPEAWDASLTGDGTVLVISPARSRPRVDTIRVNQDILVGDDFGEFGGAIWHHTGANVRDTLHVTGRDPAAYHADNLHGFARRGDEVYAIVGLAHLHLDSGELLYLARSADGDWEARSVLDLRSAPSATARVADDTLLVLTSDSLLAVALDPVKPTRRALAGSDVWWGGYGSSLVRDHTGVVFIGMRSAVVRLRPGPLGYREDWLVPVRCRTRILGTDGRCSCQPGIGDTSNVR